MLNKLDTRRNLERKIRHGGLNRCICASVLSVLCVLPSFGATNPQITKLIKEKQQKYAQLEQCAKGVKGFKIAGISTLGLTAVGIGGNIALASKNKQLDKQINGESGLKAKIEKEQEKLEKKNDEIAAEKLKIQQKQDCDARGDNWEWTVTGCKEKTDNSNSGNSNQNSGGNNQNQVNARKIGTKCSADDIAYTNNLFKEKYNASYENTADATYQETSYGVECFDADGQTAYCLCAANRCVQGDPFTNDDGLAICKKQ